MGYTVIIYEDEPIFRKQLENVFSTLHNEFRLLDSFPDADDVMTHLVNYNPDMIILDIQMKNDDDGLYALYKIKNASPGTKVMMLTTFDQDDKIFNAISLGADGYMLKTDFSTFQLPQEALRKSLRIILEGGAYLTPRVAKQILQLFSNPGIAELIQNVKMRFNEVFKHESIIKKPPSRMTPMQLIVLQEIAEGKSTSEIARALKLTENTINTHIKAIYNILEVNSRTKAIRKAMEKRLIRFATKV